MQKISPFLWFDNQAEEAARHYVSIFRNSRIGRIGRYGDAGPGPKGTVMTVEDEVDNFWEKLSEGGAESQCGWLKDKYGLSWQIVPTLLPQLMTDPDPQRAKRAMEAMLKMKKIDIAALQKAADQQPMASRTS